MQTYRLIKSCPSLCFWKISPRLGWLPVITVFVAAFLLTRVASGQDLDHYAKVANRLVALINAGDYAGIQTNFNRQMDAVLPPEKSSAFFAGLTRQMGKIEKLGEPHAVSGAVVYPAMFENGTLDMQLALEGRRDLIAGLRFKPSTTTKSTPETPQAQLSRTDRYTKVANQLVALIKAEDYSGVENLFNKEMGQALPLEKATEFFQGLNAQVGAIQKLDEPKSSSEAMIFPARCERGILDLSLALDDDDKIAGLLFGPHAASSDAAPKNNLTELSPPFKGKWLVFWGGDTKELNHHHDVPAQKFAFDLLGVDENGQTHRGDGSKNEDYFCFGREILAPADGVVVEAIDGVRDNVPGSMNAYCLVGNCVVIQHRTNEVSVLAHFQRGSVAVKAGDLVKRGQLLGKCGNSGNSSEPHLHYHLQDSPIFQDALGIKIRFQKVLVTQDGKTDTQTNYSPVKGDIISPE